MASMDEFFGNFLKTEDILGETVVEIASVVPEVVGQEDDPQRKLVVYFNEFKKGLALNKTNAESIADISGTREYDEWVGTKLCLYIDPKVTFHGRKVGGIRVKESK